ncbi:MAG TPA: hypothetical protein VFB06_11450 [Streptosporangiaceae bacterium]|nr:hypothetical protein [Streptosporangiaceae bacterium]
MRLLGRLTSMILPWPGKGERQAAIVRARQEKERSQASAAHAERLEGQVRRMAAQNHFAASIAEQIIRHHRGAS